MKIEDKELIASIQKAIRIIETFSEDDRLQSIQELTDKTGYSKTAVHRIVQTLVHEGWMIQDVYSKRYGLLGYEKLILVQESLIKICDPVMRRLRDEFNETVTLVVFEKDYGRCVHKIESEHYIKLTSKVGKTLPLYAGATAKCILAFKSREYIEDYLKNTPLEKFTENTVTDIDKIIEELDEIRDKGYASSESEVDMDIFTVSAPIFTKDNNILGCISVSCPTYRYTPLVEERMIKLNTQACREVSEKLGKF